MVSGRVGGPNGVGLRGWGAVGGEEDVEVERGRIC